MVSSENNYGGFTKQSRNRGDNIQNEWLLDTAEEKSKGQKINQTSETTGASAGWKNDDDDDDDGNDNDLTDCSSAMHNLV